jgi:hypothetical protein
MIIDIPKNQLCQAFDPMRILPIKTREPNIPNMTENTGCLCPAYFYMEGIHGKRFLCDFHFAYEKDIVMERTPNDWPKICEYLINKLENVAETFAKDPGTEPQLLNKKCTNEGCSLSGYVSCINIENNETVFCNFHYRKRYYRFLSNNIDFLKLTNIFIDERYRMPYSVEEEMLMLTYI